MREMKSPKAKCAANRGQQLIQHALHTFYCFRYVFRSTTDGTGTAYKIIFAQS